jgi:hypothetical protein
MAILSFHGTLVMGNIAVTWRIPLTSFLRESLKLEWKPLKTGD